MATYTGFITWAEYEGTVEEIDVEASNAAQARVLVQAKLDEEYYPGGDIVHVEERFGLFW